MTVNFEVVVDIDLGPLPERELIALRRQRPQHRPFQLFEEAQARAGQLLEGAPVESVDQLPDDEVELAQAGERAVPEPSDDPAICH